MVQILAGLPVVPVLILILAGAMGAAAYSSMTLVWEPLSFRLRRHWQAYRYRQAANRRAALLTGRTPPDPIEAMAAAAGYPLGWKGQHWQGVMISGATLLVAWGLLFGRAGDGLLYAAGWPVLVMAGLRRWRAVYLVRRKQEAEDFLLGLEVLLDAEDVPGAIHELKETCPLLAPALDRCWRAWGSEGGAAALASLCEEVPELEAAVAALQQAIVSSPKGVAAALRQEAQRMQHMREGAVEAQLEVQAQLFKLTIIPPGITLIRVVFGAIWHFTLLQFYGA